MKTNNGCFFYALIIVGVIAFVIMAINFLAKKQMIHNMEFTEDVNTVQTKINKQYSYSMFDDADLITGYIITDDSLVFSADISIFCGSLMAKKYAKMVSVGDVIHYDKIKGHILECKKWTYWGSVDEFNDTFQEK